MSAYDDESRTARLRALEERLAAAQAELAAATARGDRLASTLREARDQIVALKEEIDRLAQPPSGYGMFLEMSEDGTADIFTGGRKLRVAVSPEIEVEYLRRGQEVMLNEATNVIRAMEFERVGEVVMLKEVLEDGERALVIGHADEERVVRLAATLRRRAAARRRLAAARAALRLRLRAHPQVRGRGARPRRGARTSTTATSVASPRRSSSIRDAVELPVPAPRPVPRAPAAPAEGDPAVRPARVRQDADRQGGRELPGQEGRRAHRHARGPVVLPQHQGPRAAQQVRRRDRAAHPAGVPARPGEGVRGHAGHRLLRRDGLAVPHPRVRGVLRRREHDRAAAAQRDRRRREPGERPGHRRVQPRGHDRPGDPAPRPARREDQDRAARRRGGPRHLPEVPQAPSCRCTPTTSPSTAATPSRRPSTRWSSAPSRRCTPRARTTSSSRSPTPAGTRRSCTSRTSTPAP